MREPRRCWQSPCRKALSSRGRGRLRGFLELRRPWGFSPDAAQPPPPAPGLGSCGQPLPVIQLNGNHIPSKQGREEGDVEIVQLIDRHLHGGLIHFGVHGLGCRGALAGLWAGLGWAGWAAAGASPNAPGKVRLIASPPLSYLGVKPAHLLRQMLTVQTPKKFYTMVIF